MGSGPPRSPRCRSSSPGVPPRTWRLWWSGTTTWSSPWSCRARTRAAGGTGPRRSPSFRPARCQGPRRGVAGPGLRGPAGALFWAIVLVLAFDTATPAVTVAVGDEGRVLAQRTTVDARRQGELLAVSIREVLAEAGVT